MDDLSALEIFEMNWKCFPPWWCLLVASNFSHGYQYCIIHDMINMILAACIMNW